MALTQDRLSAQYAWCCHGRSQLIHMTLLYIGHQRAKTTSTAVKFSAPAGTAQSQRRFLSDKPVQMFSLTPSVMNKKRNSPKKRTTTQSPAIFQKPTTLVSEEKASGSEGNEKLGYRESSLSQQEVLLAKGGSQKLSELLADDKLWEDIKS